ncbi:MAG TPA: hypothetical protein VLN90_03985 [Thioalkalivibrio sp.]|nr:hypothetical protein [Thioalkalivibrio sp.]
MWFIDQWVKIRLAQASARGDLPGTGNLVAGTADFQDVCERIKGR